MKVLIVDDEPHVILAVRMLVDWKKHGISTILESTSATDALALFQTEFPDIIITDIKMPDMTGIDLIRQIQSIRPVTQSIIISGFDQYDYMRNALQFGCIDYILKPIQREQINVAVERAVLQYQRISAKESIEHRYGDMHTTIRKADAQKLLLLYFSSHHPLKIWKNLTDLLPNLATMTQYRIGIIDLQHFPPNTILTNNCIDQVASIFNDALFETGLGVATVIHSDGSILFLISEKLHNPRALFLQLLEQIYQQTGVRLHIGLSHAAYDLANVKQLRDQAKRNSISYNLLSDQSLIHLSAPDDSAELPINIDWFQEQLFTAILSGNRTTLSSTAKLCTKRIMKSNSLSIYQLEKIRLIYSGIRMHWIEDFNTNFKLSTPLNPPEFCFHMPFLSDGSFSAVTLEKNLYNDICAVSDYYTSLSGQPSAARNLFYQIHQYISVNYAEKLTLASIAKHFALNASYLSRTFKQIFDTSVIEYLTSVRIEKSKQLLENSQFSIKQIAISVGYEDEKYFSRVFKKQTKLSPLQYRSDFFAKNGTASNTF